ncbi:MAG TPA: SGNH/GDSL hydrolase family protein [Candidatus Saccharimonadales bacterium]
MPRKRLLSLLCAVVMACLMIGFSPLALADGEITSVVLSEPVPMSIYSHGNGSVTGVQCDSTVSTYQYGETYGSSLHLAATYKRHSGTDWFLGGNPSTCESAATGRDGTLYMLLLRHLSGGYETRVVAVKNGVQLWSFEPVVCQNGASGYTDGKDVSLRLGKDGNVYGIFYSDPSNQCPGYTAMLIGINAQDGSLRFKKELDAGHSLWHRVFVNEQGLSVVDHNDYRFFSHEGEEDTSRRKSLVASPQEEVHPYNSAGNIGGDVVYTFSSSYVPVGLSCSRYSWARILKEDGSFVSVGSPECNLELGQLTATPDGGFVALGYRQWSSNRLLRFGATGDKLFDVDTGYEPGFNNWKLNSFKVAADGRVIALYRGIEVGGDNDGYVGIYSYTATGNRSLIFSTEAFAENSAAADYFQAITFTLATDTVYIALCEVSALAPTCVDMGGSNWLVKVSVSGMTFDYPRSEALLVSQPELEQVGLGDSYSSGHANGTYISPSDTNGCNRSATAYPVLLDQDTSLQWNLAAFVACAGATIQDVINGKNGEPSQLDVLTEGTEAVTITIGGNDAFFEPFATACAVSSCAVGSTAYNNSQQVISTSLQGDLEDLFEQISLRAPNANVFVIGYPKPFSSVLNPVCNGGFIPPDNQTGARQMVESLNNVLFLAVQNSGSKFHYVDPEAEFDGHRLCEEGTSYLIGINFLNNSNSFHPNGLGHKGLAAAVKAAA